MDPDGRVSSFYTHGNGIEMQTSCNSKRWCSSSYSMLTSQPPSPFSEGQQLTVREKFYANEKCPTITGDGKFYLLTELMIRLVFANAISELQHLCSMGMVSLNSSIRSGHASWTIPCRHWDVSEAECPLNRYFGLPLWCEPIFHQKFAMSTNRTIRMPVNCRHDQFVRRLYLPFEDELCVEWTLR